MKEVRRILYGFNAGAPVESLVIPDELKKDAEKSNYDLKAYKFKGNRKLEPINERMDEDEGNPKGRVE